MINIELLEYETNEPMGMQTLAAIPRVGEFLILEKTVTETWKDNFYLVRAVTYTTGLNIIVHVEKLNHAVMVQRDQKIRKVIKDLVEKTKEKQNDGN